MFKRILLVSLCLLGSVAFAGKGNEGGGGGGGFVRSGSYVTFGSAGFQINPTPLTKIPGLDQLKSVIANDLPLSSGEQSFLLQRILPMGGRKYFDVPSLDPAVYQELQKKYATVTNEPESSIVIFAVTDTRTRETYILPSFYKLNTNEQSAILFHEGYWLLATWGPSYRQVVTAEIALQKYLERKQAGQYDEALGKEIAKIFNWQLDGKTYRNHYGISLKMDLAQDKSVNALAGLGANATGIPVLPFLEKHAAKCFRTSPVSDVEVTVYGDDISTTLYTLAENNPKSLFLRNLLDYLPPDQKGNSGYLKFDVATTIAWNPNTESCYDFVKRINPKFDEVLEGGDNVTPIDDDSQEKHQAGYRYVAIQAK